MFKKRTGKKIKKIESLGINDSDDDIGSPSRDTAFKKRGKRKKLLLVVGNDEQPDETPHDIHHEEQDFLKIVENANNTQSAQGTQSIRQNTQNTAQSLDSSSSEADEGPSLYSLNSLKDMLGSQRTRRVQKDSKQTEAHQDVAELVSSDDGTTSVGASAVQPIKVFDDSEIKQIKLQKLKIQSNMDRMKEAHAAGINENEIQLDLDSSSDSDSEMETDVIVPTINEANDGKLVFDKKAAEVEMNQEIKSVLYEYNLEEAGDPGETKDEELQKWENARIYNAISKTETDSELVQDVKLGSGIVDTERLKSFTQLPKLNPQYLEHKRENATTESYLNNLHEILRKARALKALKQKELDRISEKIDEMNSKLMEFSTKFDEIKEKYP